MHNLFAFDGAKTGKWRVLSQVAERGASLDAVDAIDVRPAGDDAKAGRSAWCLKGQISNLRYATRAEVTALRSS